MLVAVSFMALVAGCLSRPRTRSGGSSPTALKKLYGAAFTTPAADMVVTQAIGRGVTVEVRIL